MGLPALEGLLGLGDERPGVVVNGDDGFGLDELSGCEGICGPHGVAIANGEEGVVDGGIGEELHFGVEAGVSGEVEGGSGGGEEEASGKTTVGAVGEGRAVEGWGHFDATKVRGYAATDLDVFNGGVLGKILLGGEPPGNFGDGYDGGVGVLSDF